MDEIEKAIKTTKYEYAVHELVGILRLGTANHHEDSYAFIIRNKIKQLNKKLEELNGRS